MEKDGVIIVENPLSEFTGHLGLWDLILEATNSVLTQGTCHFTLPSHLKHCPETSNALLFINHTASNEPDFVYELHEFACWESNL